LRAISRRAALRLWNVNPANATIASTPQSALHKVRFRGRTDCRPARFIQPPLDIPTEISDLALGCVVQSKSLSVGSLFGLEFTSLSPRAMAMAVPDSHSCLVSGLPRPSGLVRIPRRSRATAGIPIRTTVSVAEPSDASLRVGEWAVICYGCSSVVNVGKPICL